MTTATVTAAVRTVSVPATRAAYDAMSERDWAVLCRRQGWGYKTCAAALGVRSVSRNRLIDWVWECCQEIARANAPVVGPTAPTPTPAVVTASDVQAARAKAVEAIAEATARRLGAEAPVPAPAPVVPSAPAAAPVPTVSALAPALYSDPARREAAWEASRAVRAALTALGRVRVVAGTSGCPLGSVATTLEDVVARLAGYLSALAPVPTPAAPVAPVATPPVPVPAPVPTPPPAMVVPAPVVTRPAPAVKTGVAKCAACPRTCNVAFLVGGRCAPCARKAGDAALRPAPAPKAAPAPTKPAPKPAPMSPVPPVVEAGAPASEPAPDAKRTAVVAALEAGTLGALKAACDLVGVKARRNDGGAMRTALREWVAPVVDTEAPKATEAMPALPSAQDGADEVPATPASFQDLMRLGRTGVEALARACDLDPAEYTGKAGWARLLSAVWGVCRTADAGR